MYKKLYTSWASYRKAGQDIHGELRAIPLRQRTANAGASYLFLDAAV